MSDPEAPDGASSGSGGDISEEPEIQGLREEVQRLRKELEDAERAAQRDGDTPSSKPSTDPADVPESRRSGFGGLDKRQGIALVMLVAVITLAAVFGGESTGQNVPRVAAPTPTWTWVTTTRPPPIAAQIFYRSGYGLNEQTALRNICVSSMSCRDLINHLFMWPEAASRCPYSEVKDWLTEERIHLDPEWPMILSERCGG